MRRFAASSLLVVLALAAAGGSAAADDLPVANRGFESDEPGASPTRWFVPPGVKDGGYAVSVTDDDPAEGKRRLLLVFEGGGTRQAFGNAIQSVDAKPLRGKLVRLTAKLRASGGGSAQLWLRVDLADRKMGFFDNMGDRPVRRDEWTAAEITGRVDAGALMLVFGVMLVGPGAAGADEFKLEVLSEEDAAAPEPPRPLTNAGLANVTAFARLFGVVRYFHPSDEAARAEFTRIAVDGVRAVEGAKTPAELASALQAVFARVAPTLHVTATGTALAPSPLPEGATEVVSWRHNGLGTDGGRNVYESERMRTPWTPAATPADAPDPRALCIKELPGGVTAWVPLAVFADARGTLPHAADGKPTEALGAPRMTADDRATRLADVVIPWNVFQHFYPYFDVVKTDWNRELATALKRAATDADEAAFAKTLRRLVAALHDGHGHVSYMRDPRRAVLSLAWDWIEGKLVVTAAGPSLDKRIVAGTVVETIDGRESADVLASLEEEISAATPQWARKCSLANATYGAPETKVKLACRPPAGEPFVADVAFELRGRPVEPSRPATIADLGDGIWYVDVDRVTTAEYEKALPELVAARGIVIDFRGYPSRLDSHVFFGHLVEKSVQCAKWNVPVLTRPDQEGRTFDESRWSVPPLEPRIKAKLVFVTGGGAISYAETCMGIVEAYHLGEIVGGPTAGTNGNVNPFTLPGGFSISWTGMKVLKHDGSQHHGVGIKPTVPVSPTIAGVAAGRDEVLDAAVALLKR